ncbi:MAG: glycosyltransferase family 39 protein, partial [Myxococcota bacterium]
MTPEGSPFWARLRDHLLEGPDAGAWASNAVALWLGRQDELDPHRLPILPYLTSFALRIHPDPALAGHLVNHLLHLALGPVVFLLGRRWMGRGPALGAALLAVTYPPAVMAAERYGVDPLVAVALPASLLAAEGAARRWALSPVFGLVVGLLATCHLTTIGMPVPALLLTLFRGDPGWRRWLGALGLVAGALLGVGLAFASYPTLPWDILVGSLAEGVTPSGAAGSPPAVRASIERAAEVVVAG